MAYFWYLCFIVNFKKYLAHIKKKHLIFGIILSAWKVSKYGVFSGPYFAVFSQIKGKYGPEKTPYLDNFQAVTFWDETQQTFTFWKSATEKL